MDPATGTLTEGDIGISAETVPFEHEGAQVQDKSRLLEIVKKLVEIYKYPYSKAIELAKKIIAGGGPAGEGLEAEAEWPEREIPEREWPPKGWPERKWPPKDWQLPKEWKDAGFPGPPKVHPDAPQVGHHFDINPLQTMEFRDRNQDGIEDRSQGIYSKDRDLVPWDPFKKPRYLSQGGRAGIESLRGRP